MALTGPRRINMFRATISSCLVASMMSLPAIADTGNRAAVSERDFHPAYQSSIEHLRFDAPAPDVVRFDTYRPVGTSFRQRAEPRSRPSSVRPVRRGHEDARYLDAAGFEADFGPGPELVQPIPASFYEYR
jgi:hypothetical protein